MANEKDWGQREQLRQTGQRMRDKLVGKIEIDWKKYIGADKNFDNTLCVGEEKTLTDEEKTRVNELFDTINLAAAEYKNICERAEHGFITGAKVICKACDGTTVDSDDNECPVCHGTGKEQV